MGTYYNFDNMSEFVSKRNNIYMDAVFGGRLQQIILTIVGGNTKDSLLQMQQKNYQRDSKMWNSKIMME